MSLTAQRIVAALDILAEQQHKAKPARSYIGASVIGHPCDAYVAMELRGWPTHKKPNTIRAGRLGHMMETMIIDELREIGLTVNTTDPTTGQQYEFISHDGLFQCHVDGFVTIGTDGYVLEVKSAKHSRFTQMARQGLRTGDRLYYDQVMTAMGMSGVHRALFIARDKDTGDTHCEIIEYDEMHFSYIKAKIDRILDHDTVERIASTPEYHRCKMCDRMRWCWGKAPPVGSWMPRDHRSAS